MIVGLVGPIAVLLLLGDEAPLLVELDLTGPGGKSDLLVVEALRVVALLQSEPGDGARADHVVPGCLPDAAALVDMVQNRFGRLGRESRGEEGGSVALGEEGLSGAASQQASGLVGAVEIDDVEISRTPLAPV